MMESAMMMNLAGDTGSGDACQPASQERPVGRLRSYRPATKIMPGNTLESCPCGVLQKRLAIICT
jgi:hypothetical protein